MKRFSVDALCLYEINLDTHQPGISRSLFSACKNILPNSRLVTTSSSIPSTKSFKTGGTLAVAIGNSSGRVIDTGTDPLGRWSYLTFACKNHRKLTLISAYQVCLQPSSSSLSTTSTPPIPSRMPSLTAYAQQVSLLRQANRTCTPRQAFIEDLTALIAQLRMQDCGILLTGDFNEPLGTSPDGMTGLCADLHLTDLMLHLTGRDEFPTYQRGSTRIDYILCDPWIADTAQVGVYEPFQYRTKGDHRNLCVDFDLLQLFGHPTHNLATPVQREFSSKDTGNCRRYIDAKHRYLSNHHFSARLQSLSTSWDPNLAEQVDRDFQRASFHAAKIVKRKPNLAYVAKLANLRKEKHVLLRIISQSRNPFLDLADSIAFQAREGHDFLVPHTIHECQLRCRAVQQEIRELEKDHITHRRNEQLQRLHQATASGNTSQAKLIKRTIAAENTKAMYRKLRYLQSPGGSSGISKLEVPRDPQVTDYASCTDWISIDTPLDIESRLRDRNRRHFGQAHGTFPTVPPFSEWVNWGASTHVAELLLDGTVPDRALPDLQHDLLRHMRKRASLDSIPDYLTIEEWIGKIQNWPEATSTSPSGFHLTHSKALVAKFQLDSDNEEDMLFKSRRQELITWQVQLLNLAICNQYSYTRWQTIVNFMILKEPNNLCINRLRVIHLYEHDFNLFLGLKWRHLIRQSAHLQLLNPGQFGGVPGRDAIQPTVIEELQYEISRASKRPSIHLDYDATACYDRIVVSLGSLIARGFGQHRNIVFVHATTLQEAKYFLRTRLGLSEASYSHCTIFPIYGSGQGAGNSPAIWCCISSVLFDLYAENSHGAYFCSPDGKTSVRIFMIGFVDDTSGSFNDFLLPQPAPVTHYLAQAQADAQRWNDILQLSGGALEPSKCSYHCLYYGFTVRGIPLLLGGTFEPQISITFNPTTPSCPLKQLPASTAHKTLGVRKAPTGSSVMAFHAIQAKNTQHAKMVARSPLSRTDAWSYYHAIYIPSITYPDRIPTVRPGKNPSLLVSRPVSIQRSSLLTKYNSTIERTLPTDKPRQPQIWPGRRSC
ncbi:hypothetical protein ACA910_005702 [Epithemia clementina (nom. ined.)]